MYIHDSSLETAQTYADKVRVLLAPSGEPSGDRGGRGPTSLQDLAQQAESLSPASASLSHALAREQADADPTLHFQTAQKLLAKALTDLEISAYLYQAAQDEEDGVEWSTEQVIERSSSGLWGIEENLQVLLGNTFNAQIVERSGVEITDLPTARSELSEIVVDTLDLILNRASETGQLGRCKKIPHQSSRDNCNIPFG